MASLLGRRAWKKCPTTAQVTHPLKQKGWTWANFCEDFHDFHVSDSSIIFTGAHRQPCLLQGDTEKVNLQAFTIKSYPTLLLWHTKCYSIASTLMHSKHQITWHHPTVGNSASCGGNCKAISASSCQALRNCSQERLSQSCWTSPGCMA